MTKILLFTGFLKQVKRVLLLFYEKSAEKKQTGDHK